MAGGGMAALAAGTAVAAEDDHDGVVAVPRPEFGNRQRRENLYGVRAERRSVWVKSSPTKRRSSSVVRASA